VDYELYTRYREILTDLREYLQNWNKQPKEITAISTKEHEDVKNAIKMARSLRGIIGKTVFKEEEKVRLEAMGEMMQRESDNKGGTT